MQVQDLRTPAVKPSERTATALNAAEMMMRDQDIGALPAADAGRPIRMPAARHRLVRLELVRLEPHPGATAQHCRE